MKTLKEKSIHVNQEAVYWWTILDIQEKKKNKKTKLKIWEGLKKSVQVVSVPMTACILKDKMKYVKYTTVTPNYSDSMNQPVWRTRPFPTIKEP